MTEGIIKYVCHHQQADIDEAIQLKELNEMRDKLIEQNWIGYDKEHEIGFGNISLIHDADQFLISGSQTGHLKQLTNQDVALVTKVNLATNELWCIGQTVASSESMTHAAFYLGSEGFFNAVLHIHDSELWKQYFNVLDTTAESIEYGTPEMAMALFELAEECAEDHLAVIMGGHQDGILIGGLTAACAFNALLSLAQRT